MRGQYEGYRAEPGVDPNSDTETFVAMKVEIDNWRWAGVPFYLRSGKSLAQRRNVVTLGFRKPALQMFPDEAGDARTRPGQRARHRLRRPGLDRGPLPRQGARARECTSSTTEMIFRYDHVVPARCTSSRATSG